MPSSGMQAYRQQIKPKHTLRLKTNFNKKERKKERKKGRKEERKERKIFRYMILLVLLTVEF